MDVYLVLFVILCDFIVFAESDRCNCLLSSDCQLSQHTWAFLCYNGCKPGWGGFSCDRSVKTTTTAAPCHCADSFDCRYSMCFSCQTGWYGYRCDKKKHTTYRYSYESSDSTEKWQIIGCGVGISVLILLTCCCCCRGKKSSQAHNSNSPLAPSSQLWRTETSADSQLGNISLSSLQLQSRRNTDTSTTNQSAPLALQSTNDAHFDPPPSYESVMSQENVR
ncbi:uncharacterized protein LOC125665959 [Ostrea edulis]|uniref:uncharacterized protein LOC125665959 n=1 Tax=Ostrea edulis TaxID=37623 RepID=UPI00209552F8|nr:uncharacterized protein LOC125665959 [Ostrea edulis]